MEWIEIAKLAGAVAVAVAVPIVAIAGALYKMVDHMIRPMRDDIKELRKDVHSIDVRLARVEATLQGSSAGD